MGAAWDTRVRRSSGVRSERGSVGLSADAYSSAGEDHAPDPGFKLPAAVQAMSGELFGEFGGLEAVGSGVVGEGADGPLVEEMAGNLFEQ